MSTPPPELKLYHIVHVDRLKHILQDGCLFSDEVMRERSDCGTNIGLSEIKTRRSTNRLTSYHDLCVGECVPFYFCPRSVMLYVLHMGNMQGLNYRGGQGPIIHLEFDLQRVVEWCQIHKLRWAFTLSNAGAVYYEDRNQLHQLQDINWDAIAATQWSDPDVKEGKQAEFLVEHKVDWTLVERIGILDPAISRRVHIELANSSHRPPVSFQPAWYY